MHDLLIHVLNLLQRGGALALGVVIGCLIAILILRLITRKKSESFPWKRLMLGAVFAAYLVVVAAGTLLRYGSGGRLNLRPFVEFIEAWNSMSFSLWMNIILNIAMFVPAGILLPTVFPRLGKWYKTLAAGAVMSLIIEISQLIMKKGAADVDDLLTNILGCMVGYSLLKAFMALRKKEKRWFIPLACPLSLVIIALGVFGVYELKEFGNIKYLPAFRADTRGIEWSFGFTPDENGSEFMVCKAKTLTKKGAESFAKEVAEKLGAEFDETYYYDGEIWFMDRTAKERDPLMLKISYPEGYYELGMIAFEGAKITLPKAEVIEKLKDWDIYLPESVDCEFEDGVCTLKADMIESDGNYIDGSVRVLFKEDGSIAKIRSSLSVLKPYKNISVVSESEACKRLERGIFSNGWAFGYERPESIEAVSVELVGRLDSKGFCRPLYLFQLKGAATPAVFVPAE